MRILQISISCTSRAVWCIYGSPSPTSCALGVFFEFILKRLRFWLYCRYPSRDRSFCLVHLWITYTPLVHLVLLVDFYVFICKLNSNFEIGHQVCTCLWYKAITPWGIFHSNTSVDSLLHFPSLLLSGLMVHIIFPFLFNFK